MSVKESVAKKEKSMAELIVVVVLLSLLMAHFISYFMGQNDKITQIGFNALANNFYSKVTVVHGQWFMDMKPRRVKVLSMQNAKIESIKVNKQGWIDAAPDVLLPCEKIWQYALNSPMTYMRSPVSAIEVIDNTLTKGRICRYSISSDVFFEYHSLQGKVIKGI